MYQSTRDQPVTFINGDQRHDGAWEAWLGLFLEGVTDVARGAAQNADAIHRLRESDRSSVLLAGGGKYDVALVEAMFRQPHPQLARRHRRGAMMALVQNRVTPKVTVEFGRG